MSSVNFNEIKRAASFGALLARYGVEMKASSIFATNWFTFRRPCTRSS